MSVSLTILLLIVMGILIKNDEMKPLHGFLGLLLGLSIAGTPIGVIILDIAKDLGDAVEGMF